MGWSSVSVVCSLSDRSDPNRCTVDLFRIVDLDKAKETIANVSKSLTTAANNDLPSTSRELRSSGVRSQSSSLESSSKCSVQRQSKKTTEKNANNERRKLRHSSKILKSPSKGESCFKSLVADFTDKNMPPKQDIVSSQTPHLTRLADVTPDDRVNVVAVLTEVPKVNTLLLKT